MGIRGGPAPNHYKLPSTVGFRRHDPTKLQQPAYTMRIKHREEPTGLGPGLFNISKKTRFGKPHAPAITMGNRLPDMYDYTSPGPVYYRPEKCNTKQNAPKFSISKLFPAEVPRYVPAPNTYKLPTTLGPKVPDKHSNAAYTIGLKLKTPRGKGIPAPNRYGPVRTSTYKPASFKFTFGEKSALARDKTQKPAPNIYYPKLKNKERRPTFSFGKRDNDRRIVYLTIEDVS